jgi:hypothetical protein
MSVLTIASSKGGPGKTTLAMLLASTLAADGYSVLLVDADPTEALSRWIKNTYEGPAIQGVAETDETRLAHLIGERADEPDLLLVDTAGFGNRAAAVAMTSSDAILVPALGWRSGYYGSGKDGPAGRGSSAGGPARHPGLHRAEPGATDAARPARGAGDHDGQLAPPGCDIERSGRLWGAVLLRALARERPGSGRGQGADRGTAGKGTPAAQAEAPYSRHDVIP